MTLLPQAQAATHKKSAAKAASAAAPAVITYQPPKDAPAERPDATRVEVSASSGDYAIHLTFDQPAWGDQCKNRCATVTLFLDTDDSPTTGLQMGRDKPETGADLVVTVQGAREYREKSAEVFLRARVRTLDDSAHSMEQGNVVAELDHRRDRDRLQSDGNDVHVLVDSATLNIPLGKTLRVIYHPPADKALVATTRGMAALGSSAAPQIIEGTTKNSHRKPRK